MLYINNKIGQSNYLLVEVSSVVIVNITSVVFRDGLCLTSYVQCTQ